LSARREALAEEIASIGKLQVIREEGKGYVTAITADGSRQRRKVRMRLYEKFKQRCRKG
jgi:hypothetical protein